MLKPLKSAECKKRITAQFAGVVQKQHIAKLGCDSSVTLKLGQ